MERSMHLASYVDRSFADVWAAFEGSRLDETIRAAMRTGLVPTDAVFELHASEPELVASGSARVRLSWSLSYPSGSAHRGTASLQLLVAQSGLKPVTEVLVSLAVDDARAAEVATVAHRLLDDLTHYLDSVTV